MKEKINSNKQSRRSSYWVEFVKSQNFNSCVFFKNNFVVNVY